VRNSGSPAHDGSTRVPPVNGIYSRNAWRPAA
jgi:hypothetical protein